MCVCMCACMRVYVLRIVSRNMILGFKNTFDYYYTQKHMHTGIVILLIFLLSFFLLSLICYLYCCLAKGHDEQS